MYAVSFNVLFDLDLITVKKEFCALHICIWVVFNLKC